MKKLLASTFFFIAVFLPISSICQNPKADSLKTIIENPGHDTILLKAWLALDDIIYMSDPTLDEQLNNKMIELCEKNLKSEKNKSLISFYKIKLLIATNNLGIINMYKSANKEAERLFLSALKLSKELNDKQKLSVTYNNFGILFYRQGNYAKSIEYYTKALATMESVNDQYGVAASLNNIGNIYNETGDTTRALNHFRKSLNISRKINAKNWAAVSIESIAQIYSLSEKEDSSLILLNESMLLYKAIGNKQGIASSMACIGKISLKKGNFNDAKEKLEHALALFEEVNDKRLKGATLGTLSVYYQKTGNISKAIHTAQIALDLLISIGQIDEAANVAEQLYEYYNIISDFKKALKMKVLHVELRDSIQNEKNEKAIIRHEFKYQYDKQVALDSLRISEERRIQKAEIAQKDAEITVKKNIQTMLFGGLAMVLLFSTFIYNRFKVTAKQKKVIEIQKQEVELKRREADNQRELVEEKNKEIMDSIIYAKRLQEAILPPQKLVKEYLNNSFILYKPKDIVAGDFYWMEHKNGNILIAAADCTGHGVPGAMVSVICNNGLNQSVREYGLSDPGKILDKTREIIIQEFEKSEDDVKDGMDISLCSINAKTLSWAGANNPLWIIRKPVTKDNEYEFIEIKANKQPIGKYIDQKPFTTHSFELQQEDTIYIFTDGFQDQFGGDKGKKFKASKMKDLFLSIQDKPMEEQKEIIHDTFERWKGDLEQIDDVCIIGVRF